MAFDTILPVQPNATNSAYGIEGGDIGSMARVLKNLEYTVFDENLTVQASRNLALWRKENGIGDADSEMIAPEEANKIYNGEGKLAPYTAPVRRDFAEQRHETRIAENEREKMLTSYANGGFEEGAGMFASGVVGMFADPIADALMLMPVVGEAKFAKYLANPSIGLAKRIGTRALMGAETGAEFSALSEPARYAFSKYEGGDYTAKNAAENFLTNVMFGSVFGAGHGAIDALHVKLDSNTQRAMLEATLRSENPEQAVKNAMMVLDVSKPVHEWELANNKRFNFKEDYDSLNEFLSKKQKAGELEGNMNKLVETNEQFKDQFRPPIIDEESYKASATQKLKEYAQSELNDLKAKQDLEKEPIKPYSPPKEEPLMHDYSKPIEPDEINTMLENDVKKLQEQEAPPVIKEGETPTPKEGFNFDERKKTATKAYRALFNCIFKGVIENAE